MKKLFATIVVSTLAVSCGQKHGETSQSKGFGFDHPSLYEKNRSCDLDTLSDVREALFVLEEKLTRQAGLIPDGIAVQEIKAQDAAIEATKVTLDDLENNNCENVSKKQLVAPQYAASRVVVSNARLNLKLSSEIVDYKIEADELTQAYDDVSQEISDLFDTLETKLEKITNS